MSPTNIWAYFIFSVETIFVSIVFKERLKLVLLPGKRFDEYIYAIIFLSILVPHFLLPVAAWTSGSEVAKFKNMWTQFQVSTLYCSYLTITGQNNRKNELNCHCYIMSLKLFRRMALTIKFLPVSVQILQNNWKRNYLS